MRAWGQATDLILLSLKALGSATHGTVAADTELPVELVRKSLHRVAHVPLAKRRAHVSEWTMHMDGCRPYWRQVYAFGPGPNAKRPPPMGHAASARRWAQRCQQLASQMAGLPVTRREARREALRRVPQARREGVLL